MNSHIFTIRDLEDARRRGSRRRPHHPVTKPRDYLIAFALVATCWLMRELFLWT